MTCVLLDLHNTERCDKLPKQDAKTNTQQLAT